MSGLLAEVADGVLLLTLYRLDQAGHARIIASLAERRRAGSAAGLDAPLTTAA